MHIEMAYPFPGLMAIPDIVIVAHLQRMQRELSTQRVRTLERLTKQIELWQLYDRPQEV